MRRSSGRCPYGLAPGGSVGRARGGEKAFILAKFGAGLDAEVFARPFQVKSGRSGLTWEAQYYCWAAFGFRYGSEDGGISSSLSRSRLSRALVVCQARSTNRRFGFPRRFPACKVSHPNQSLEPTRLCILASAWVLFSRGSSQSLDSEGSRLTGNSFTPCAYIKQRPLSALHHIIATQARTVARNVIKSGDATPQFLLVLFASALKQQHSVQFLRRCLKQVGDVCRSFVAAQIGFFAQLSNQSLEANRVGATVLLYAPGSL